MTASEKSFVGLAKQSAFGTAVTDNTAFKYFLFTEGTAGPNNQIRPLDTEVGGGALLRSVVKTGVVSSGGFTFIPRPEMIGFLLMGAFGSHTFDDYLGKFDLTSSGQTGLTPTQTDPGTPMRILVGVKLAGGNAVSGNVVINGTKPDDSAETETIAVSGTASKAYISTKTFKTVTSVNVPARGQAGDYITIGRAYTGAYTHKFQFGSDQFAAPFYTVRNSPGSLWGEQYADCRITATQLNFTAADFVRGQFGFMGRLPTSNINTTNWNALANVDGGPQFIATVTNVTSTDLGTLRVRSGTFTAANNIPLEEQWLVGSYLPFDLAIVSRAFSFNLVVYAESQTLYQRLMYDRAGGANWVANVFKSGDLVFNMISDTNVGTSQTPYSLSVTANGRGYSTNEGNAVWTAEPLAMVAQRKITMAVTGTILADPTGQYSPVTAYLVNNRELEY